MNDTDDLIKSENDFLDSKIEECNKMIAKIQNEGLSSLQSANNVLVYKKLIETYQSFKKKY